LQQAKETTPESTTVKPTQHPPLSDEASPSTPLQKTNIIPATINARGFPRLKAKNQCS
jgi:hypothetical protein